MPRDIAIIGDYFMLSEKFETAIRAACEGAALNIAKHDFPWPDVPMEHGYAVEGMDGLKEYYGTADEAADELEGQLGGDIQISGEGGTLGAEGDTVDAPIIKMVTMMLLEAHNMRASDIHLEPLEKRFRVRFRIDGVLHEMTNPPKKLQSAITSRIKKKNGSI